MKGSIRHLIALVILLTGSAAISHADLASEIDRLLCEWAPRTYSVLLMIIERGVTPC